MSTDMIDYVEAVWIRRDIEPDWDAAEARLAEATLDEDEREQATDGLAAVRDAFEGDAPAMIDVGPYRVYLSFDDGWNVLDLDLSGVLSAAGFWLE